MRTYEIIYSIGTPREKDLVYKMSNLRYNELHKYLSLIEQTYSYKVIGVVAK